MPRGKEQEDPESGKPWVTIGKFNIYRPDQYNWQVHQEGTNEYHYFASLAGAIRWTAQAASERYARDANGWLKNFEAIAANIHEDAMALGAWAKRKEDKRK